MPVTKDQLSQKDFGYLKGSDLMQFAPFQLLAAQYDIFPDYFQLGCDQSYSEITSELSDRYDITSELSNANQILQKKTGAFTVELLAESYVSRIILTWDNPVISANLPLSSPIESKPLAISSPLVKIGTSLGGEQIMTSDNIEFQRVLWVNKYFSAATTLYFTIENGNVNIDMACNTGKKDPTISVVELLDKTDTFEYVMPANSNLYQIFAKILLSTPSIKIGTTEGDDDICPLTVIDNDVLPITTNYFNNETTLYFAVTGGSTDLRMDIGFNFIAPNVQQRPIRNAMMVKIVTILALRNILGSASGDNKKLQSYFEWCDNMIEKIKNRQASVTLDSAPETIASRAYTIPSSFNTIG